MVTYEYLKERIDNFDIDDDIYDTITTANIFRIHKYKLCLQLRNLYKQYPIYKLPIEKLLTKDYIIYSMVRETYTIDEIKEYVKQHTLNNTKLPYDFLKFLPKYIYDSELIDLILSLDYLAYPKFDSSKYYILDFYVSKFVSLSSDQAIKIIRKCKDYIIKNNITTCINGNTYNLLSTFNILAITHLINDLEGIKLVFNTVLLNHINLRRILKTNKKNSEIILFIKEYILENKCSNGWCWTFDKHATSFTDNELLNILSFFSDSDFNELLKYYLKFDITILYNIIIKNTNILNNPIINNIRRNDFNTICDNVTFILNVHTVGYRIGYGYNYNYLNTIFSSCLAYIYGLKHRKIKIFPLEYTVNMLIQHNVQNLNECVYLVSSLDTIHF